MLVNHVMCEAYCATWSLSCFLCTGSDHYIWGHWRSAARLVCNWYPLSVCQFQSKHDFCHIIGASWLSQCEQNINPTASMNYQGSRMNSGSSIKKQTDLFVLGVLFRGRCWACCLAWRCLCGSASEPRYTPLVSCWPGPCRWPPRAATSQSDQAWTGRPAPSRHRQAPSSQRCTTTVITSERLRL